MTTLGFMTTSTSQRALGASGELRSSPVQPAVVLDFAKLEAVESRSILGQHDGTLPDDLMELLEASAT